MSADENPDEIQFDDRYEDGEGREWAVRAVNIKDGTIRLRLVNPPERIISLEHLQSQFKVGGLRAIAKKWEKEQQELRDKLLPKGPGEGQ